MKRSAEQGRQSVRQGQAAVYRVISELLLRGIGVAIPATDFGVDLLTDHGVRIQVKSSMLHYDETSSNRRVGPTYTFIFRHAISKGLYSIKKAGRNFVKECDFVILFGIEQNKFWVVPAHVLDGVSGVKIATYDLAHSHRRNYPTKTSEVRTYEDRWDLIVGCHQSLEQAKQAIAEIVPVSTGA